jgi:hypothetical protein
MVDVFGKAAFAEVDDAGKMQGLRVVGRRGENADENALALIELPLRLVLGTKSKKP